MPATYDPDQLDTSDLMQVRFLSGDIGPAAADFFLQDSEIEYVLGITGSTLEAAVYCCKTIAARLSRKVDYMVGPHKVWASQLQEQFLTLAATLEGQSIAFGVPAFTSPAETVFYQDMMSIDGTHLDDEEE